MSYSQSIYNPIAYVSSVIALNAILLPAVVVLHFLVFRHVKAEGDRVRSGFKWLHAALFTLFITTAVDVGTNVFILAWPFAQKRQSLSTGGEAGRAYMDTASRLSAVQTLTYIVAEATLIFCVLRLVISAATPSPRRLFGYVITAMLGLAVAGGIVLVGYGIWMTGFRNRQRQGLRNGTTDPLGKEVQRLVQHETTMSSVHLTVSILMVLAAAGVFAQAMKARKTGTWVVRKLAVVAGLVLFIMVWRFVYTAVSLSGRLPGTNGLDITGMQFADIILAVWGSFGVMVMIYLVGKKREGGLWSENRGKVERSSEEGVTA